MAEIGTTIVYPKQGTTLYLPGGVHGFTDRHVGVPLRSDHAEALRAAGGLETAGDRQKQAAEQKAADDLATAQAEVKTADAMPAAPAA